MSARGMPKETAVFRQAIRSVTDPAMVPSARVASGPLTVTSCPPRSYLPSVIPAARMVSEMSTTRSEPNILNTARTTLGWMCTPSQISSTRLQGESSAAPTTPGARWVKPGMALKRWVTSLAPSRKASRAVS